MSLETTNETAPGNINPFEGCIPDPIETDLKAVRAVEGFNELGVHLAASMRKGLLPVDEAIVGSDVHEEDESGYSKTGSRLPVWLILEDTKLTGEPLFTGQIGVQTCSYSLLSGTPNDFRTNFKKASKKEILEFRGGRLGDVEQVFASESAIGLDGLGRFVKLVKDIEMDKDFHFIKYPENFSVAVSELKPSDFFNLKTKLSSEQLVDSMKTRMQKAIAKYTALLQEERSKLKIDEPLNRPLDYYDARSGLLYRHENLKPKEQPKKRKLLRILNREA